MGIFNVSDLKEIGKVLQQAGQSEMYAKLIEAQQNSLELIQKNKELGERIKQLKDELDLQKAVIFEDDGYWKKDDDGNKIDGPFCPSCYDNNQKLGRLLESKITDGRKNCSICGKPFPLLSPKKLFLGT